MTITNKAILAHEFLTDMYNDQYFPKHCVDLVKDVLLKLCQTIEEKSPQNLDQLYLITEVSTEEINDLCDVFDEADSEIETVARESIGQDFTFIAHSYGFIEADHEMLISGRDW